MERPGASGSGWRSDVLAIALRPRRSLSPSRVGSGLRSRSCGDGHLADQHPTTEALVVKILRAVVRDPKFVAHDPSAHSVGTLKFHSLVIVTFAGDPSVR